MRRIFTALSLLSLFAGLPSVSGAQVAAPPTLMNFQGRLTTPSGNPVPNGTYSIRFSLWSAVSGGTEKWNQTISSVSVTNGTFAVLLNTNTANLFDNNLWLEIKIGTDTALTPRQQLVSVAYAQKAGTVPDGSITNSKVADGTLTASKFLNGVLTPGGVAGGDLTGFYPNPSIKTDASLLYKVSGTIMSASGAGISVNAEQLQAPNEVTDSAWQSFTPTVSGNLTGLDIYCGTTTGVNKTIPVVIYSGEGITGTELARKTITFIPAIGFQHVDFTSPIPVVGGQKYTWFVGTSSSMRFGYTGSSPYPDGRADVGATLDYAFRTYQTTGGTLISTTGGLNVAGKVGIGTTNPVRSLEIGNTTVANTEGLLRFGSRSGTGAMLRAWEIGVPENDQTTTGSSYSFAIHDVTSAANILLNPTFMIKYGTGNVGLGTGTPSNKLSVNGGADISGNVGIGTTSPTSKLDVRGGDFNLRTSGGGTRAVLGVNTGTDSGYFQIFGNNNILGGLGGDDAGSFFLNNSAGTQAAISAEGNSYLKGGSLGIGTDNPQATLDVNGGIDLRGTNALELGAGVAGKEASAGTISYQRFSTGLDIVGAGTNTSNRKINFFSEGGTTFNGNVAIGASLTAAALNVKGAAFGITSEVVNTSGQAVGILGTANGNISGIGVYGSSSTGIGVYGNTDGGFYGVYSNGRAGGTGGWTISSDARYKTNVETFENALDAILNLRGVRYDWKQNEFPNKHFPEGRQIGFIAQEVEKVLPEIVYTDPTGYKSVSYANAVPVLVEAVKVLNSKVERLNSLEVENAALKAQMAEILRRLNKIERKQ